jgi:hypothetical protein
VAAVEGAGGGSGLRPRRQWQRRGQATVVEAETAQWQTTINQKAVAIAAETVVVAAEMAAALAVAAAMATAAMGNHGGNAAAMARQRQHQQGQRRRRMWGGGHLSYICIKVHTEVITIALCILNTLYVLAKHFMFLQNIKWSIPKNTKTQKHKL